MTQDKNSDLPASERHLGWAISAVLAGAMVTHERWEPGVYWALGNSGMVREFDRDGNGYARVVDLNGFNTWTGFYIHEPEPEPETTPVTEARFHRLADDLAEQARDRDTITHGLLHNEVTKWVRAIREEIRGEFEALSNRITDVSRISHRGVADLKSRVSGLEVLVGRVNDLENGTTRGDTIGGVDPSKL